MYYKSNRRESFLFTTFTSLLINVQKGNPHIFIVQEEWHIKMRKLCDIVSCRINILSKIQISIIINQLRSHIC